eukprot:2225464-Rhodomonas_salina.1
MGGNVIEVPVHTAKIAQQLLSANRRLVLTIAGGVGRLTPAFLERVEVASVSSDAFAMQYAVLTQAMLLQEEYGQFARDAETGN